MESLTLVSNPGSASRKYAIYKHDKCLLKIHFEQEDGKIVYSLEANGREAGPAPAHINSLTFAGLRLEPILAANQITKSDIKHIALRIVAPTEYFQADRVLNETAIEKLTKLEHQAPIHINATLQEIHLLKKEFPDAKLVGVSDSAFHSTMPEVAKHYALPNDLTKKYGLRRFGYHGLSAESIVDELDKIGKLPKRLVICHLGSGVSVTAVKNSKSIDTTMGYSPLEGLMMSTRSGNVDVIALQVLQEELKISNGQLQDLLNHKSGLLGVSGKSSDIRELLKEEKKGNKQAELALDMYVYKVQQAVGQMAGSLGGVDALVLTGTVGERNSEIRKRILKKLAFLGLNLDAGVNYRLKNAGPVARISPPRHPAAVYVVHISEDRVMAKHAEQV